MYSNDFFKKQLHLFILSSTYNILRLPIIYNKFQTINKSNAPTIQLDCIMNKDSPQEKNEQIK